MKARLQIVRCPTREPVDLDRLAGMRPDEIRMLHRKMYNCDLPSGNTTQARRKIAWYLQEEKEGGLPATARQYALAIAREASSRIRVPAKANGTGPIPHATVTGLVSDHDPRLPMPGSMIVKEYRGRTIVVRALDEGFEYDGRRFSSLSAVAKGITGTKWNGLAFFGMVKRGTRGR